MNTVTEQASFEPAKKLVDEMALALMQARGMTIEEAIANVRPIVAYLQQQYGGDEMYVPRPGRTYPIADIVDATRRGEGVRRICSRFGISRRTYFWLMAQHR